MTQSCLAFYLFYSIVKEDALWRISIAGIMKEILSGMKFGALDE